MRSFFSKFISLFIIFLLPFGMSQIAMASENSTLDKAQIEIDATNQSNYSITQTLSINAVELNEIEHISSNINNVKIEDLSFVIEEEEVTAETIEGDALDRHILPISGAQDNNINYEISYNVSIQEGEYTIPLVIPNVVASGDGNIVNIEYEGPENSVIQGSSFPVVKGASGNTDSSYMMNIPAHVKYVLDEETSSFSAFDLIGWGTLLVYIIVIVIWIRSEAKAQKMTKEQIGGA